MSKRVCVIGAGPAGLCAAKVFRQIFGSENVDITIWETQADIGGTWICTDVRGADANDETRGRADEESAGTGSKRPLATDPFTYSAMYPCLRTNIPTKLMEFSDFPFPPSEECNEAFPPHTSVLNYIRSYATHFDVAGLVRAGWKVVSVKWIEQQSGEDIGAAGEWEVVTERVNWLNGRVVDGEDVPERQVHRYDAVVCCNGHYYADYIPAFPGLASFPGRLVHSHSFRDPEEFSNQKVNVVGSGASAVDIARLLVSSSERVFLSLTKATREAAGTPIGSESHPDAPGAEVVGEVERFEGSKVVCEGTEPFEVDVVMIATGFLYDFPFLRDDPLSREGYISPLGAEYRSIVDESKGMEVNGLWKQCIYPHNPTLSMIGLPLRVIPFPLFEGQAALAAHILRGTITCPPPSVCHDLEQHDAQKHGAGRARHVMGGRQWEYHDEIVREIEAAIAAQGDDTAVGTAKTEEWRKDLRVKAPHMRRKWVVNKKEE